jgi:hypothetical protein
MGARILAPFSIGKDKQISIVWPTRGGVFGQRHFGWDRDGVRRGRPGLAGSAPSGLVAVGVPAANSLSRIFVRVGNGLNGPTFAIPDSMPGSLDCAARELQSPGYSVDAITNAMTPQAQTGSGIPVPP